MTPAPVTLGRVERFYRFLCEINQDALDRAEAERAAVAPADLPPTPRRPVPFEEQIADTPDHGVETSVPHVLMQAVLAERTAELGTILYDVTDEQAETLTLDQLEEALVPFASASDRLLSTLTRFAVSLR